jgi:hypothetical protein
LGFLRSAGWILLELNISGKDWDASGIFDATEMLPPLLLLLLLLLQLVVVSLGVLLMLLVQLVLVLVLVLVLAQALVLSTLPR